MSVTAVGPALGIDGPTPAAPPYSLLSVPGVLTGDGDRWMNGVNIWGYPEDVPSDWEACSTGSDRVKGTGDGWSIPRFDPIAIYVATECSSLSIEEDWEGFQARAEAVLSATQSYALEHALAQGATGSSNPFLGDANLNILGGGAVAPQVALAYLEDGISTTGRAGIIHAPPSIIAALGFNYLKICDPDGQEDSGDEYICTANGTPVASGDGYVGSDPVNGTSPSAGKSWMFATGPVEVRLSELEMVGNGPLDNLDRSDNVYTFRAEKYALVSWDTALQDGVLVDWTL